MSVAVTSHGNAIVESGNQLASAQSMVNHQLPAEQMSSMWTQPTAGADVYAHQAALGLNCCFSAVL